MSKVWTIHDEREYQVMTQRRNEVMDAQKKPVWDVAVEIHGLRGRMCADIQTYLMKNADRLRDVLAPFDSGVRPKDEPALAVDVTEGGSCD